MRHLAQFPGEMAVPAEKFEVKTQRLLPLTCLKCVGNRFFDQVERGLLGRQVTARPPDQADEPFDDQLVPEAFSRRGQLTEVIGTAGWTLTEPSASRRARCRLTNAAMAS